MSAANPTALVADDEPLLRARLVSLLSTAWPQLTILPQAQNGREAVELCETHRPDIAFLDIRMPLISGIDVARMLPSTMRVVFVTAYDEYAVRAFEAGAADYLIKPIEPARLTATVTRLKASLQQTSINGRDLNVLLSQLSTHMRPEQPRHLEWIRASVGSRVKLMHIDDILYFRSDEKYTRVGLQMQNCSSANRFASCKMSWIRRDLCKFNVGQLSIFTRLTTSNAPTRIGCCYMSRALQKY
jgi:DNA-binding LytR/AlgR family response regulator